MRQAGPGNVRELRNTLKQASLMADDLQLLPVHIAAALPQALLIRPDLPAATAGAVRAERATIGPPAQPLPTQVAELERRAIAAALTASGGNRVAATRALGISRAAFYDRWERWPELALLGR